MSIQRRSMRVVMNVSQWSARKLDRKVSAEVNRDHNAASDAARVNKLLLGPDALASIAKTASAARLYHYSQTLPWSDLGDRLLLVSNYQEYRRAMRDYAAQFDQEVATFLATYPEMRDDARRRLGTLYRPEDYPHTSQIRGKFAFRITYLPVEDGSHVMLDLAQTDEAEVRAQVEQLTSARVSEAMRDVWGRLHGAVDRMATTLAEEDRRFTGTLVSSLRDLVQLLPRLNLTNDPALDRMAVVVARKLTTYDPDQLREDPALRKQQAEAARQIADQMAGFMSGFGVAA